MTANDAFQRAKAYIKKSLIGKGAIKGERGERGENGKSAYDVAVDNGFIGTVKQWLDSLVGKKGDNGIDGNDGVTPNINITATNDGDVVPVDKKGNPENPSYEFKFSGIIGGGGNGKVKMENDGELKFLKELLDAGTIEVVDGKAVIKKIDGLTATVAELNFLAGAKSNIQAQIDILKGVKSVYGVFDTKAGLNDDTGSPEEGQMALIRHDESEGGKQTSYVFIKGVWEVLAEVSFEVRDFKTDPIDLASEVKGVLPKDKIDRDIARAGDVLDKATYAGQTAGVVRKAEQLEGQTHTVEQIDDAASKAHEHANKSLLDSLKNDGDGNKFLNNKGEYKEIKLECIVDVNALPEDDIDDSKIYRLKLEPGWYWTDTGEKLTDGASNYRMDFARRGYHWYWSIPNAAFNNGQKFTETGYRTYTYDTLKPDKSLGVSLSEWAVGMVSGSVAYPFTPAYLLTGQAAVGMTVGTQYKAVKSFNLVYEIKKNTVKLYHHFNNEWYEIGAGGSSEECPVEVVDIEGGIENIIPKATTEQYGLVKLDELVITDLTAKALAISNVRRDDTSGYIKMARKGNLVIVTIFNMGIKASGSWVLSNVVPRPVFGGWIAARCAYAYTAVNAEFAVTGKDISFKADASVICGASVVYFTNEA